MTAPATSLAAWDAPADVSDAGADAFAPQVAVATDGDGVIVWQRDGAAGQEVQAATVSATGAVGAVQTLSSGGTNEQPAVAVDDDGNAVVVWRRSNGGDVVIQSNTLSELGVPGSRQTISDDAQDASDPAVGMDAAGNALIAWEFGSGANRRIQARDPDGSRPARAHRHAARHGRGLGDPRGRDGHGGEAVIAWLGDDGTASRVRAVTMSAAGVIGPMETVSTAAVDAESVGVGIDADGDAVITWLRFADEHFRVYARTLSAAGALGTRLTLSRAGEDAFLPEIAVAANGRSAVTWQRFDGSDFRVQAVPISAAGVPGTVKTLSASRQRREQRGHRDRRRRRQRHRLGSLRRLPHPRPDHDGGGRPGHAGRPLGRRRVGRPRPRSGSTRPATRTRSGPATTARTRSSRPRRARSRARGAHPTPARVSASILIADRARVQSRVVSESIATVIARTSGASSPAAMSTP